jgi:hypothetical protein
MSGLNGESSRILQNFIGGEYVDSIQTPCKYIPVTTPHTGEVIAQCPISTAEDVEKAVEAAKEAYKSWRYYHIFHIILDELITSFLCFCFIVLEQSKIAFKLYSVFITCYTHILTNWLI